MSKEQEEFEDIYEPLRAYKNTYKEKHNTNVNEYFNQLVEEAHIDTGLNKSTNDKIRKLQNDEKNTKKLIRKKQTNKALLWILTIISLLAVIYGINQIIKKETNLISILCVSIGVILIITSILLIFKRINPKLKVLKNDHSAVVNQLNEQIKEAYKQLEPLNSKFTETMGIELFKKTLPNINMDLVFDSKRLDYLVNKFGLGDLEDVNRSSLYVQSGDIKGNPFYLAKELVHKLGTKAYTGSITIHWTTTSTSNGKTVTHHHTQTLSETIQRPYPYYSNETYLVYGNEAAPDLIFSRTDSDAENMTDKQIQKKVEKDIKKISKKSEKSISKGGGFTVMANSEFEVFFKGTNRNNEAQYRLLFTPLAQQQLLELMKDKEYGYGDDFDFVKHKKINVLYPEHLKNFEVKPNPKQFRGYDLEVIKEYFVKTQNEYFRQIYFTFAPILAIPLYQQHKTQEYIYKDVYDSYVSFYEHEAVANGMSDKAFQHPLSSTPNILKTRVLKSANYKDKVEVTAYGYETQPRVEYFTKFGRDGRLHTIPVHWTEYLPVAQNTELEINVPHEEKELSHQDRIRKLMENAKKDGIKPEEMYKIGLYLAYIIKK